MSGAVSGFGMTSQRTRTRMIERLREQGIVDEEVLAAIAAVPRHVFVEEALASRAYEDTALPLGFSQTISQPYVVARMIEALRAGRQLGKTLEIGAGCGYQAAVLAQLTDEVYAVERIEPLLAKARINLRAIKQLKVRLKHADGQLGLPEAAPFDTIIVAAAASRVPPALLRQLAPWRSDDPAGGWGDAVPGPDRTPHRGVCRNASRRRSFCSATFGSRMKDQWFLAPRGWAPALTVMLIVAGCASKSPAPVADRSGPSARRQRGCCGRRQGWLCREEGRHAVFDRARSWAGLQGSGRLERARESESHPRRSVAARARQGSTAVRTPSWCGRWLRPPVEQRSLDGSGDLLKREPKAGKEPYSDQALARAQAQAVAQQKPVEPVPRWLRQRLQSWRSPKRSRGTRRRQARRPGRAATRGRRHGQRGDRLDVAGEVASWSARSARAATRVSILPARPATRCWRRVAARSSIAAPVCAATASW
jgi:protein-L-isoaspartate(D-aspartate) O-methyltransferase